MSNDVFGYISHISGMSNDECWNRLGLEAACVGLGLRRLQKTDIYGLQMGKMGQFADQEAVYFRVTDGPDMESASYLIDLVDYSPDATLSLPHQGLQRLELLLRWIDAVLKLAPTSDMMVVLTDSNELDGTREVTEAGVRGQLVSDFADYAPPNAAYKVSRAEARLT